MGQVAVGLMTRLSVLGLTRDKRWTDPAYSIMTWDVQLWVARAYLDGNASMPPVCPTHLLEPSDEIEQMLGSAVRNLNGGV